MDYNKTLASFNEQIKNWDFKKEQVQEYLRLLTDRNMLIAGHTPIIDFDPGCETPSKNTSFIGYEQENPEHLAFHVGAPHQKRLYALISEKTKNPFNKGVFFSFDIKDTVYFAGHYENPERMTYFLDSASAKEAIMQKNYSMEAISRYDLDDLLEASIAGDQGSLRRKHQELNDKWVKDNTVPFNIDEIKELKQKNYIWLVIPDPVDVKY